ncbi:hypothetical protein MKK63_05600 [Methylobacterium sp. J-088]|uniref:hypothetical protein n=1 Tax=Methylobacterium sp. J-088 TaxID=2836664 RepID=UPI001FBB86D4|nr:hypothetical protein [Methylobacterium sp. J-088]MCJ2062175.1 hypothetical protein [Methylobacterium sp. J-088]
MRRFIDEVWQKPQDAQFALRRRQLGQSKFFMRLGGRHLPKGFFGKAKLTKRHALAVRNHQRHGRRRRRRGTVSVQFGVLGVTDTIEGPFLCRRLIKV